MFEDSTFESNGRIRTRSRGWMIATLLFNGSILLALILIPLIYPVALPRQVIAFLMPAPAAPAPRQPPPQQPANAARAVSEIKDGQIFAPPSIPTQIVMVNRPEAPPAPGVPGLDDGSPIPGGASEIFRGQSTTSVVRPDMGGRLRVSSTTVEALVVHKTIPVYPAIAKTAGIQGTVVLAATISKAGTIENLRVVSGHPMLQQAALDAVKTWLYRPYQLNGQPVEVETTVNVVFTLTR